MTIGLFAPLPLAIMIPFMAAQSAAMALAFGTNFQYGKRKISSMSNEEFNALTPEILTKNLTADIGKMIPHVQQSMQEMSSLQGFIIRELIEEIKKLPENIIAGAVGAEASTEQTTRLGAPPGIASFLTPIIPTVIPVDPLVSGKGLPTPVPSPPGATAIENYASKWIRKQGSGWVVRWANITLNEIRYLINERVKGNLFPQLKTLSASLLAQEKKLMKELAEKQRYTPEKVVAGIEATPASSIVTTIATLFNQCKAFIALFNNTGSGHHRKKFTTKAMEYNRFVQANRKANLTINIAKSLAAGRIQS